MESSREKSGDSGLSAKQRIWSCIDDVILFKSVSTLAPSTSGLTGNGIASSASSKKFLFYKKV